jgi:hypothetical protein
MFAGSYRRWFSLLSLLLTLALPATARANRNPAAASPARDFLTDTSLSVRSWEKEGLLGAEIAGFLDYPVAQVSDTLIRPEAWCEFLPLVFNIKSCTYAWEDGRQRLTVYVGRKFYEAPEESYRLDYLFRVQEQSKDRVRILLFAPAGPAGTGDYRIEVEVRAKSGNRTSLRLYSSFRPSLRSRLATKAYLSTAGRDKIGFTVKEQVNGEPVYVGGTSGIVERNAMRYYLALKAHLDTLQLPEKKRFEARLHAWYDMTDRYPRQLFEMPKAEYLAGKRKERREQLEMQRGLGYRSQPVRRGANS